MAAVITAPGGPDWIALTTEPLHVDAISTWATTPEAGAVVAFLGVVRNSGDGRSGVVALTYEAYDHEAERVLAEIAVDARRRWPAICRVALLHRTGAISLSEASVAVAVSSPHRAVAFDAARHCIDLLKETVPIWKQEHWDGGLDWGLGATPIRQVRTEAGA